MLLELENFITYTPFDEEIETSTFSKSRYTKLYTFTELDQLFELIYNQNCQSKEELKTKLQVVDHLEDILRGGRSKKIEKIIGSQYNLQLKIFGSSANGFGMRNADIDIKIVHGEGETIFKRQQKIDSKILFFFFQIN